MYSIIISVKSGSPLGRKGACHLESNGRGQNAPIHFKQEGICYRALLKGRRIIVAKGVDSRLSSQEQLLKLLPELGPHIAAATATIKKHLESGSHCHRDLLPPSCRSCHWLQSYTCSCLHQQNEWLTSWSWWGANTGTSAAESRCLQDCAWLQEQQKWLKWVFYLSALTDLLGKPLADQTKVTWGPPASSKEASFWDFAVEVDVSTERRMQILALQGHKGGSDVGLMYLEGSNSWLCIR